MASQADREDLGIQGFKDSKRYEEVRPDYPREAVKALMIKVGVLNENGGAVSDKSLRILELGAGTGKFTRVMADVLKDADVHIIASDPVKEMCEQFTKVLPDIEIKQFSADNIDAVDQSFDAVIAVGCFHWFTFEKSLNEIHRVLAPGGMFGLAWIFLHSKATWQQSICNYLAPMYKKNSIVWPVLHFKELAKIVSSSNVFVEGEKCSSNYLTEKKISPDKALEYLYSVSVIATCSDENKEEFKDFFYQTIEKHLATTQQKEFTITFEIPLFWFQKSSSLK